MTTKSFFRKQKLSGSVRAQAMIEFAIVLPVLLALLVGIMEVGRMLITYALLSNASRDAVRYASSVGIESTGAQYVRYAYCAGIKEVARKSSYFLNLQPSSVTITYDSGPGTTAKVTGGCNASSGEDVDVLNADISSGDRVTVSVSATYSPVVKLIPISSRTFTATSSRTIVGIFDLDN